LQKIVRLKKIFATLGGPFESSKEWNLISYVIFILFAGSFFFGAIRNAQNNISAAVLPLYDTADTIQKFERGAIIKAARLEIDRPGPLMRFLAPGITDPLYCLLLLLILIVLMAFFWDFSYEKPFTRKALWGLRILLWLVLIFLFANHQRYDWFDKQVRILTGGAYEFKKPFPLSLPEWLAFFILLRLLWMFKRGVALQKESEFTV
jgi:hypothetical protein